MSEQAVDSLVWSAKLLHGPTGAQDGVFGFASDRPKAEATWRHWIDNTLIEWGRNPAGLADDGVTPPSSDVIAWAIRWAQQAACDGDPPADRVVPNGDGGIVFELWNGRLSESIEIEDDGCIYHSVFSGSRLVGRELLNRMRS